MRHDDDDDDMRTTLFLSPEARYVASPPCSAECRTCGAPLADGAHYCGVCGQCVRPRQDSLTGAIVDDYEIHEQIADGGYATVYRARMTASRREVALKVLHTHRVDDPSVLERFRREARCLVRLRDRHTVITYDAGVVDNAHYIAMELLRGKTLRERLREGAPLPWREVLSIIRAVCSSLTEAHSLGYVHRDLKPANIFIGTDGIVKVIDFGLAKRFDQGDDLTNSGQAVGTLQYMSPEQLLGGVVDQRSDLYALGVIGYEMISGRRPFGRPANAEQLAAAFFVKTITPPSAHAARAVPAEIDELVLRCLSTHPADRFGSATELAGAIDALLAREDDPTTPEPAVAAPTRLGRIVLWATCALTGGLGIGTVVALVV